MIGHCIQLYVTVLLFSAFLAPRCSSHTDPLDVQALQDLYRSLNRPVQLKGWKLDGGDPCGESWAGVSCSGTSVVHMKLDGLKLNGSLGFHLNFHHLKHLDVSSNNIEGPIPYGLPLNLTHLNLACNNLTQSLPYSVSSLIKIRHMNLSHNFLSGPIGNVFTDLTDLQEMDLSHNHFTGDLPNSFGTLKNLSRLFLQSNRFTGSVIFLAGLQLTDLNIEDNHFSGIIPRQFQSIHNLWYGGNMFGKGENNPPWDFPLENIPNQKNVSSPPSTVSSAIVTNPSREADKHKKKGSGAGGIALTFGASALVATCALLFVVIRKHQNNARKLRTLDCNEGSRNSLPISMARECSSTYLKDSPAVSAISSFDRPISLRHLPPIRSKVVRVNRRRSFSRRTRIPAGAKLYTVAELQSATNSFSESNLLGEGSLGSVYKAKFSDGLIFAVKNINTVALSLPEEQQFLDVIWHASRLRHPNIVQLHGYCVEHGQHILVYEYIRNFSLDHALHYEEYGSLSWCLRLRIALGIARALSYLHCTCIPPIAHSNLKAANVLLDEDLVPRICDSGLAVLKPLTSKNIKLKASERAACDTAYIAPEHIQTATGSTKGDVYAFGVILLELLTGRKPFDSSRPREEHYLVKWASSQLHDNESLDQMVDPAIRGTIPPKALSRFADIVSLCVQPEKGFRPPISEILESLTHMMEDHRRGRSNPGDGTEDMFERSFRSTNSRFMGSPTFSYLSI